MPKFQVGQTIGTIYPKQGFEKAKIMRIQGNSYYCKIMCGIAFIPIASEDNYKVLKWLCTLDLIDFPIRLQSIGEYTVSLFH